MTDYFFVLDVQFFNGTADETNTRPLAKLPEIDVTVIKTVMASDQPRQHSRIGRISVFTNERNVEVGYRLHAHVFDYGHVTMATADQNYFFMVSAMRIRVHR